MNRYALFFKLLVFLFPLFFILYFLNSRLSVNFVFADDDIKPRGIEAAPPVVYTGIEYDSPFKSWLPERREIDEFQQLIKEEPGAFPVFHLQGVVWGGAFPQAIINDSVVDEGDLVENAEILEINKDEIKLRYKDKTFFLRVTQKIKEDIDERNE